VSSKSLLMRMFPAEVVIRNEPRGLGADEINVADDFVSGEGLVEGIGFCAENGRAQQRIDEKIVRARIASSLSVFFNAHNGPCGLCAQFFGAGRCGARFVSNHAMVRESISSTCSGLRMA